MLRETKHLPKQIKRGFTLLELLLVIAIIASLAGIILMALNPAQRLEEANEVKSLSNAKDIEKALNAYVVEHGGQFPTALQTKFNAGETRVDLCKSGQTCNGVDLTTGLITEGYLSSIPIHPTYATATDSGYDIFYNSTTTGVTVTESPVFLLRDDFITADAAPITSPRTAEPGPGIWTSTGDMNDISISGGRMIVAAGAAAKTLSFNATRTIGLAAIAKTRTSAVRTSFGFGTDRVELGQLVYIDTATISPTPSLNTDYDLAWVAKTNGNLLFIKGGVYPTWTLFYTGNVSANNPVTIGAGSIVSGAGATEFDSVRVLLLPAPFNNDYGLATQRLAGSVAQGTEFTHEANCIIEWIATTLPSDSMRVQFRRQDSLNTWEVVMYSTGTLYLYEYVDSVQTSRGSAAAVVANGHRIVVVADGTTIRIYSNNVLRITYSSATNFQTEVAGRLNGLGTGGVVSDIVSWPRTLSGDAAAVLENASL